MCVCVCYVEPAMYVSGGHAKGGSSQPRMARENSMVEVKKENKKC